jgi:hypothetical protein
MSAAPAVTTENVGHKKSSWHIHNKAESVVFFKDHPKVLTRVAKDTATCHRTHIVTKNVELCRENPAKFSRLQN